MKLRIRKNKKAATGRIKNMRGTKAGPILTILGCLLMVALAIVAFIRYVPGLAEKAAHSPLDLSWLGVFTPVPDEAYASPTPIPTKDPASNHALYSADLSVAQHEVLLNEYQFLADVRFFGGEVWCAVGPYDSKTGLAALSAAACIQPDAGTKTYIPAEIYYNSMRFPIGNENWVVFADVQNAGGGRICRIDRRTGEQKTLKTVHIGVPIPFIHNDSAFWVERTGTNTFKLFGCDLATGESVTLDVFSAEGGVSRPFLWEDTLLYNGEDGVLFQFDLTTGEKTTLISGTRVHDAKTNGKILAYLTGYHDLESELVYIDQEGNRHVAAQGVTDFALGDGFIAYGDLKKCYVYLLEDGVTFCLTRAKESALFIGADGDLVFWLDTSWRDKDVLEFMHVNHPER